MGAQGPRAQNGPCVAMHVDHRTGAHRAPYGGRFGPYGALGPRSGGIWALWGPRVQRGVGDRVTLRCKIDAVGMPVRAVSACPLQRGIAIFCGPGAQRPRSIRGRGVAPTFTNHPCPGPRTAWRCESSAGTVWQPHRGYVATAQRVWWPHRPGPVPVNIRAGVQKY